VSLHQQVAELKELCKKHGVRNVAKLRKIELIEALRPFSH
jgi:Rho termination factor, N-terminal domain